MPWSGPGQAHGPEIDQHGTSRPAAQAHVAHRTSSGLKSWFHVRQVSGNLTRDFSARERTYLSWVKISIVLGGIGAVMLVQLDAPTAHSAASAAQPSYNLQHIQLTHWPASADTSAPPDLDTPSLARAMWMARHAALRRSQTRRAAAWALEMQHNRGVVLGHPQLGQTLAALRGTSSQVDPASVAPHKGHQHPFIVPPPTETTSTAQVYGSGSGSALDPALETIPRPSPYTQRWPTSIPTPRTAGRPHDFLSSLAGSIVSGTVYFLQALVALIIGLADYLRTERALEKIDEINENETQAKQALAAHTAALKSVQDRAARAPSPSFAPGTTEQNERAHCPHHSLAEPPDPTGSARPESAFVLPPPPETVPKLQDDDIARARSGYLIDVITGLLILLSTVIAASAIILLIDEA